MRLGHADYLKFEADASQKTEPTWIMDSVES